LHFKATEKLKCRNIIFLPHDQYGQRKLAQATLIAGVLLCNPYGSRLVPPSLRVKCRTCPDLNTRCEESGRNWKMLLVRLSKWRHVILFPSLVLPTGFKWLYAYGGCLSGTLTAYNTEGFL